MAKTALFMENTEISAERTASEISSCLIQAGANQIACDYEDGKIKGLRWTMKKDGMDLLFHMPARVEPVYRLLLKRNSSRSLAKIREQAERVAWRQLYRWVQAQMAMIQTGMVQPSEVFLAYWDDGHGQTLFERMSASRFKALPSPAQPN